ncbi:hypothetical protein [Pseudomonas fluorescens]|uniref:Uncharacterized protein n=1 Tax=Pseudomonas fluorescens TaxID=294 RepID=A0A0F4VGU2_PSEFL|nr:hypothetical protein [Pseudomonas fluorescens]KJZ67242.1 hypothetical protein VD17_02985 [Pseudomonas fluorescens]
MALYTFTATDQNDFVSKLLARAVGEGWTLVRDTAVEKVLKIPAVGYLALLIDGVNVEFQAFRLYDAARAIADQIGSLPTPVGGLKLPRIPLHNQAFQVWLSVSERRLAGVCRISNTYHSFYAGLILPFAPTDQYPFPCYVGGSGDAELWSSTSSSASAYPFYGGQSRPGRVCLPGGGWQEVSRSDSGDSLDFKPSYLYERAYVWPFDGGLANLGKTLAGEHVIYNAMIVSSTPAAGLAPDDGMWLGYLDGIFACSNVGASAESVITIDSIQYLLVPNVFRGSQYYAFRLN